MSWKLALEYLKALVWPGVAVTVAVMFKKQVAGLIDRLNSFDTPVGKATFDNQVGAVDKETEELVSGLLGERLAARMQPAVEEVAIDEAEAEESSVTEQREGVEDSLSSIEGQSLVVPSYAEMKSSEEVFSGLMDLAHSDPTAAVLGAWREVDSALSAAQMDVGGGRDGNVPQVLGWVASSGMLSADAVRSIQDLRELRNRVAHGGDLILTSEGAQTYVRSSRRMIDALALARTPEVRARAYELALQRSLERMLPSVILNPLGRRGLLDFAIRDFAQRSAVVQWKYRTRRPIELTEVLREVDRVIASKVSDGLLIVTNAPLSESVRRLNSGELSNRVNWSLPLEVIQWNGPEDDDLLLRALGRVAVSA